MDVNDHKLFWDDSQAEQVCQDDIRASTLLKYERDEHRAERECLKKEPFFGKVGWTMALTGMVVAPVAFLLALPVPVTVFAAFAFIGGSSLTFRAHNIHREIYLDRLTRRLKFLKIPKEDIDQTIESIQSKKRDVLEGERISGLISERRNEILGVTLPSQNETSC